MNLSFSFPKNPFFGFSFSSLVSSKFISVATEINLDETKEENEKPKKGFFGKLKDKFNNLEH